MHACKHGQCLIAARCECYLVDSTGEQLGIKLPCFFWKVWKFRVVVQRDGGQFEARRTTRDVGSAALNVQVNGLVRQGGCNFSNELAGNRNSARGRDLCRDGYLGGNLIIETCKLESIVGCCNYHGAKHGLSGLRG